MIFEGGINFTGDQVDMQAEFTTPGSYTWVAPAGVTSVCVVCVGGGAGGSHTMDGVYSGGDSYFINDTTVKGGGGPVGAAGIGVVYTSTFVGDGGGAGGSGGWYFIGGGGAGGYSGSGGDGAGGNGSPTSGNGRPGTGGAGGGGAWLYSTGLVRNSGGGGGGVGIYGEGVSGGWTIGSSSSTGTGGHNGSSGLDGYVAIIRGGYGGLYGGGGGGSDYYDMGFSGGAGGALGWKNNISVVPGQSYTVVVGAGGARSQPSNGGGAGAGGAVRIIWGAGRSFPSTRTANEAYVSGIALTNPDISYSVTPSATSINEGSAVTFNINTNITYSNPTLYWTTSGTATTSDYNDGVLSGSVALSNGIATVVRTSVNNPAISANVTCIFELRTGSTSGPIVATASTVTIVNTTTLVAATGGTVTTSGNYKIHVFTASGTFTVTSGGTAQVLVVGGGGAGSGNGGNSTTGGGGAGGLIWDTAYTLTPGAYPVTVGAGGVGAVDNYAPRTGNSGAPSIFGSHTMSGGIGGSYNGGGNQGAINGVAGNAGKTPGAGGGGGAGAAATSINGGNGILITELVGAAGFNNTGYFAGGGAGYAGNDETPTNWGTASSGGGSGQTGSAPAGTVNTGGGGASQWFGNDTNGYSGGSGIVVVRYRYQ